MFAAGIEGELERTPPGSDVGTASSSNEAEATNGFSQSELPVFSLRKALITPRRETGNTPALCENAIANGSILPERMYDTTIPARFTTVTEASEAFNLTGLWGDSHRESRRTTLLRYFPDLCFGHWESAPFEKEQAMDHFVVLRGLIHIPGTRWYLWKEPIGPSEHRALRHRPGDPLNHWMFAGPPLGVWRLLDAEVGEDFPLMSALEYANIMRGRAPHDLVLDELVIERILAIARYLHQLNQHLYTRNRHDRETLAQLESQLEVARNDARQLRAYLTMTVTSSFVRCSVSFRTQLPI